MKDVVLSPDETLDTPVVQASMRSVMLDGIFSQLMVMASSGIILVSLAVDLGASNFIIGLISTVPLISQFFQIPAIKIVEKARNRRLVSVISATGSRLAFFLIITIPFLFPGNAGLIAILLFLIVHSIFTATTACAWNSWMHDLIPATERSTFFAKRMAFSTAISMPVGIVSGIFLNAWKVANEPFHLHGYAILFIIAFCFGIASVVFLARTREPRIDLAMVGNSIFKRIKEMLRDANFKNLIWFLVALNFAINLSAPFFTVYLLKQIGLDIGTVIILTVSSQLANITFFTAWGRLAARFSNKTVLNSATGTLVICLLAWTFTTLPTVHVFTLPLLFLIHVFMGIATAGINLASLNIGLKLAPKGKATAYLASKNFLNALAAAIAPVIGGLLVDAFAGIEFSITVQWLSPAGSFAFDTLNFQYWDFFFFFAFILGIFAIHRLCYVKEPESDESKITLRMLFTEVRRGMRGFSTFGGLRAMQQFPYPYRKEADPGPTAGDGFVIDRERLGPAEN